MCQFVLMGGLASQKLLDNYITMYVYHPAELHGSEEMGDKLFLFLNGKVPSELSPAYYHFRNPFIDKMVGAHLV